MTGTEASRVREVMQTLATTAERLEAEAHALRALIALLRTTIGKYPS